LKKPLGFALLLGLLGSLLQFSCSLVVDDLQKGCAAGTKPCEVTPGELRCVSTSDPAYGCARESCVACRLPNAVEVCDSDGECAVGACVPGFQNCDHAVLTGCEVALGTSYENCGRCGTNCDDALREMKFTKTAQCSGSRCVAASCEANHADCDGITSNGCERPLDPTDCGRCDGCPQNTVCNGATQRCE
jgi:hypothetical protein